MTNVKDRKELSNLWQKLNELGQQYDQSTYTQMQTDRNSTNQPLRLNAAGLIVDLSRQMVNDEILQALFELPSAIDLGSQISDLLSGQIVNNTENRAAHHSALRLPAEKQNNTEITAALDKVCLIADQIRTKTWRGSNHQTITDIVNIGIGGSDLGPRMVCHALTAFSSDAPNVHFVANVDPQELDMVLGPLSQCNTLLIVASKSFTTTETLENALAARNWLRKEVAEQDLSKHVIAVSSNVEKATAFGVDKDSILPMWDWVGGRYSLWSAIGLPIAIKVGGAAFRELLSGAHEMDQHFSTTPFEQNAPCLLALLEVWYTNICSASSVAVLPYSHELKLFPEYLQQLTMESNGKQVAKDGSPLTRRSCATVWGSAGTVGQHSFHQLLHQGTELIPVDFILPLQSHSSDKNRQAHLVSNCLAQSKALSEGKSLAASISELKESGSNEAEANRLAPHKVIPGNRPNTIIAMDELTPKTLGALIALYEHKVFVQSTIWGNNAFDQWGVELGKQLSAPIFNALTTEAPADGSDSVTDYWIHQFKRANSE